MRDWREHCRPENIPRRREITERRFKKIDTHREKKKHRIIIRRVCPRDDAWAARELFGQPRISKSLLECPALQIDRDGEVAEKC